MAQRNFQEIYKDGSYLAENPDWHAADAPIKASKMMELLKRQPVDFKSVGEVGCGSGEILVSLARQLPDDVVFKGFDISPDAINIAKQKTSARISFELKDLANDNEAIEPFDLLLIIDVIEHIENYFQFIRGISTKGRFTIFHIPLDLSVWTIFREKMLLESKAQVGHIHNFTEDFIKSVLADFGYKILAQIYTKPIFRPQSRKQKIVEFCRSCLFSLSKRFCSKLMGGISIMVLAENPSYPAIK